MALVSAYVTMLPRLQAAEQLDRVRSVALGSGNYATDDAAAMLAELRSRSLGEFDGEALRQAQGERKARQASPDELAGMGIGAVMMPPPAPGSKPVEGFDYG